MSHPKFCARCLAQAPLGSGGRASSRGPLGLPAGRRLRRHGGYRDAAARWIGCADRASRGLRGFTGRLPVANAGPLSLPLPLSRRFAQTLARLKRTPSAAAYWLGASPLAIVLPLVVLVGFVALTAHNPRVFSQQTLDLHLPSEAAIPAAIPAQAIDPKDPTWLFRYGNTGTEFRSGIPYWVFRVMPRIFDEEFKGQGYEHFGFGEDSHDYYFRRPVGRGLVLSDATVHLPGVRDHRQHQAGCDQLLGLSPRRVSDEQGCRHFIDGMPNHTADLQGFKRFFTQGFKSPRFTEARVIAEINQVLTQEEHRPALTRYEELVYVLIVQGLKRSSELLPSWPRQCMDEQAGRERSGSHRSIQRLQVRDHWRPRRQQRGAGRFSIDLESAASCAAGITTMATPMTREPATSARSGVGGMFLSIPKGQVLAVGEWLDVLPSPAYPFDPPEPARVARGLQSFRTHCAACHGLYERSSNRVAEVANSRYMQVDPKVGTDPERLKAFAPGAAAALNDFGERRALWRKDAFRSTGAYLAGPLDGIWARAPYLHNGSVPSLAALLQPPAERPKTFIAAAAATTPRGWDGGSSNRKRRVALCSSIARSMSVVSRSLATATPATRTPSPPRNKLISSSI